jgi:hypothetical protein
MLPSGYLSPTCAREAGINISQSTRGVNLLFCLANQLNHRLVRRRVFV